jgi:hypothetical protein
MAQEENSYNIYDLTHSRGKYKILVKNGKTPAENVDVGFYIPAHPFARDSKNLILRPEDDKFPSKWNGNCVNLVGKWVLKTFPKNKKVNEYEFEDIPEFRNWCGLPHNMSELYLDYYLNDMQKEVADRKREAMLLRTPPPPPPPSVKIPNTKPKPIQQYSSSKPIGSPSSTVYVNFEWPEFDETLFNKICKKFTDDIVVIKKYIPPDDYRDNDVTCCSPALITIAKDMIMLFMKHKITTPHAHATNYENGYKVLILSVIGYYFIQNEWENALERVRISLPKKIFDDSMMIIMEMVKSGFGHNHPELDSELREITKRLFVVDNIRSIQKPNDGGGRRRSTRRRKLKPSKRRTKHYK